MSAHTPGPWRVRRHGRNFSITSGLPGRGLLVVADVFDDTPAMGGTPGEADAHLIAAAPDLYAVCNGIAAGYMDVLGADAREALRAALKKARGE